MWTHSFIRASHSGYQNYTWEGWEILGNIVDDGVIFDQRGGRNGSIWRETCNSSEMSFKPLGSWLTMNGRGSDVPCRARPHYGSCKLPSKRSTDFSYNTTERESTWSSSVNETCFFLSQDPLRRRSSRFVRFDVSISLWPLKGFFHRNIW